MLYLLPNLLQDQETHTSDLPSSVDAAVYQLNALIAESEKEGRRFLKRFSFPPPKTFREIPIHLLNEHSTPQDKKELLAKVKGGGIWGLISDCGMPCLADPGADLVLMAREHGLEVRTFAGPSSILFALVLSGLGGQRFSFHGYLPKEEAPLIQEIKRIEKLSRLEQSTHLFIETPYRNLRLFRTLLSTLDPKTWLSIACDLSSAAQTVETYPIGQWRKKEEPKIDKRPAVFVMKA